VLYSIRIVTPSLVDRADLMLDAGRVFIVITFSIASWYVSNAEGIPQQGVHIAYRFVQGTRSVHSCFQCRDIMIESLPVGV
jgi:hypothetical protein